MKSRQRLSINQLGPRCRAANFLGSEAAQPRRPTRLWSWVWVWIHHSKLSRFLWLATLFFSVTMSYPNSNDLTTTFEQANRLYEQGKFSEAAAAYETLIKTGKASASLYFNHGNALFKSGQIGRAVVSYQLAERLAPRDPDIRANLRFAREAVSGSSSIKRSQWKEWLQLVTLNELTLITAAAVWLWLTLLILRQLRADWRKNLKGYTSTIALASILLGGWLGFAIWANSQRTVVVVVPEAVVRYGPLDESQSYYTMRDGAELSLLDRKAGWLQVQDGLGRIGWLRSEQIAAVAPVFSNGKS
jgi:tetratricopeptide (TPR) repeat protein